MGLYMVLGLGLGVRLCMKFCMALRAYLALSMGLCRDFVWDSSPTRRYLVGVGGYFRSQVYFYRFLFAKGKNY